MSRRSSPLSRGKRGIGLGTLIGDAESSRFGQGLMLGAMVGAAIAGSTIWARVRRTRDRRGTLEPGSKSRTDPFG